MAKTPKDEYVFLNEYYDKNGKKAKDAISILQHDWEMRENYLAAVRAERIAIAGGVIIAALLIIRMIERMVNR